MLKKFKDNLREFSINTAWKQWTKLGIPGRQAAAEKTNVDPEALILLTGFTGTDDLRLIENVIGWLIKNENLIIKSRLKSLLTVNHTPTLDSLTDIFFTLGQITENNKWQAVAEFCQEKKTTQKDDGEMNNLLTSDENIKKNHARISNNRIIFRKLFGPSTRAEVFNFFTGEGVSSSRGIAEYLQLSQSTVYSILEELVEIGLIEKRGKSRNTSYRLIENSFQLAKLQPEEFFDWGNYFHSIIAGWRAINQFSEVDTEYKKCSALNKFYQVFNNNLNDWNLSFATKQKNVSKNKILEINDPDKYILEFVKEIYKT